MPRDLFGETDATGEVVVYCIEHRPSGAIYVGKTGNWSVREARHRRHLRNGMHCNAPLQALATQDGCAALMFAVWWWAPANWTDARLREAEDAAMQAVRRMGRPLLNVLRPATRPDRAFSVGPGARLPRRPRAPTPRFGPFGALDDGSASSPIWTPTPLRGLFDGPNPAYQQTGRGADVAPQPRP